MNINVGGVREGEYEHGGLEWGHVVRTHMTIEELLSIGTIILFYFSGVADPFQLRFDSSVIHIICSCLSTT